MIKNYFTYILTFFFYFSTVAQTAVITLQQITPEVICSTGNDSISFSVTANGIAPGSNIVFYIDNDATFNPYNSQGDSIGFIHIPENKKTIDSIINPTCVSILGIFINACNSNGLTEQANEYMLLSSGNGFAVNDLGIDFNSEGMNGADADINYNGSACQFGVVASSLMDSLRIGSCNPSNLIAANPGDFIPADALVIVFTGAGEKFPYNFSGLCDLGKPIYVLQNACLRSRGAFANAGSCSSSLYRTTGIHTQNCNDELTYNRCGLVSGSGTDGDYALITYIGQDTVSVANGGITNNAADACNGISADSFKINQTVSYQIPFSTPSPLSSLYCNQGKQYIKAIVNPANNYIPKPISNFIGFNLICLDITATNNKDTICSGETTNISSTSFDANVSFTFTINGGTNISGASNGTGSTINQTLTNTGNSLDSILYTITASDNTCSKDTTIKVFVRPNTLTKPNLGNDTAYCGNFSRVLSTGNANTTWTTPNGTQTGASITATQAGTYIATIATSCITVKDTIVITQNQAPTINLGNDYNICSGTSTTLNATTSSATYIWSTGASTPTISINQAGIYWVDVTVNACTARDSITIGVTSIPTKPNLGNDTAYCGNFSRVLSTGNANTTWTTPSGTQTGASITATQAGTYIATIATNCITVEDTIVITQNQAPTINLGNDYNICSGTSTTLNATTSNATYVWSTGASTPTISINQAGIYWVDVTVNACTARDSITIGVTSIPTKPNLGNDTAYCGNFSRVLYTGNATTTWSTGATGASITVTQGGEYIATIATNCITVKDTIVITQNQAPTINLGNDYNICSGTSTTLNATTTNTTYIWSTGASTPTISINQAGIYWVDVTVNACTARDSITIGVTSIPTKPNLGNDTAYCGNFSRVLYTGNATTTWTTPSGTQTGASITATQAGTYIATIATNCITVKDTIVITQNQMPTVNLGEDTAFCDTTITLSVPSTFQQIIWSTGETSNSININEIGAYFVIATDNNNCVATDTVLFTSNCLECEYFLPNAFTPNKDGHNDNFGVVNQCVEANNFLLQIFDRWGELIFETNDANEKWNGTYKNEIMHVDSYLWILSYTIYEHKVLKKGIVNLLR
ncbi:MAG: gliding motility-associated C-terminal domain-containing protein [Chitinophagales bacterium]|nr:gliding motility-associated C-terminal domain-containing protein [Chitinophagales bacterium]